MKGIPMKTVPLRIAITVAPALAAGAFQQRPAPPSGPVAFVVSQRISNETTEGKAGIARMQALQRERTADARTKQEALQATRRQIDATAGQRRAHASPGTGATAAHRPREGREPESSRSAEPAAADLERVGRQGEGGDRRTS